MVQQITVFIKAFKKRMLNIGFQEGLGKIYDFVAISLCKYLGRTALLFTKLRRL